MSLINSNYDPEALLENVDGCVLSLLKKELSGNGSWEKLAAHCYNMEGRAVFRESDLKHLAQKKNPTEAFLEELVKRNVTMKYLVNILKKSGMDDVLKQFGVEEAAKIHSQSFSGLMNVKCGESIEITVNASGIPFPTFLWYKGESPLMQETSNKLHISEFDTKDEGIYLCLVRQTLKEEEIMLWSSPVQLCVQEMAPSFIHHPLNTEIVEGAKLELVCLAEGYPPPSYSWMKDDEVLIQDLTEPDLKIESVCLQDAGIYKCIAKNSMGQVESSAAAVEVLPKGRSTNQPQIIQHPMLCEEKPERAIGQMFTLVCSARCSQNVTFDWVINGKVLEEKQTNRYIVMTSSSFPDFSSSLLYTVGEDSGSTIKAFCVVRSADATVYSREVRIKVTTTDGPVEYYAGTKWSLLIANADYSIETLPRLYTPLSDLEKLAKKLREMDFHCLLLTNLGLTELKNSVKLFASIIKPGDYVVFCYAGHGLFSGEDLLLPVPNHNSSKELETVSSVWVRTMLQKNDPSLLFIVLDMCRHIHHSQIEGPNPIYKSPVKRNCVILNATSEGYQSLEDPQKSSILTSSLVNHLKDQVDVVTMAKAVLRDVAHLSPYVRSEQIPKLDVNLCDNRSLSDPQKLIDGKSELLWSSLTELPQPRIVKTQVDDSSICVKVSFDLGGAFHLVSNVVQMELEFLSETVPAAVTLAFNVQQNVKQREKRNKAVIYEMNSIQKIEDPLVLTIQFRSKSGETVDKSLQLGQFGLSKLRLFDKEFEPSLRVKKSTYNIP